MASLVVSHVGVLMVSVDSRYSPELWHIIMVIHAE